MAEENEVDVSIQIGPFVFGKIVKKPANGLTFGDLATVLRRAGVSAARNGHATATSPETALDRDLLAGAFNAGSDARLMGLALSANPHAKIDYRLGSMWTQGWRDVNVCWGRGVNGRWTFRPLPEVEN